MKEQNKKEKGIKDNEEKQVNNVVNNNIILNHRIVIIQVNFDIVINLFNINIEMNIINKNQDKHDFEINEVIVDSDDIIRRIIMNINLHNYDYLFKKVVFVKRVINLYDYREVVDQIDILILDEKNRDIIKEVLQSIGVNFKKVD